MSYVSSTQMKNIATAINNTKAGAASMAPAYDNTIAYKVGILLSYQGKLYECIKDATAGTLPTNTTYFKEVSVAEVVGDLQTGLENGTIVPNKSRATESIENVSDESGTTQDNPFISQGTGTNNNVDSVDTSPVAKQIEKQGYTVANNQYGDSAVNDSYNVSVLEYETGKGYKNIAESAYTPDIPVGHKALITLKTSGWSNNIQYINIPFFGNGSFQITTVGTHFGIKEVANNTYKFIRVFTSDLNNAVLTIADFKVIDLTQYFNGNSNIPQDLLDNPSHWSWYDNGTGSYDAGSLKNASGRYLVCTHRNLFNPNTVTTGKQVNGSTGELATKSERSASDYIVVCPNRVIHSSMTSAVSNCGYAWYDNSKNYISGADTTLTGTVTVPANARFLRFTINTQSYNPVNVCISLYYSVEEGGEGYTDSHPYQEPSVYDTGTEELLAFDTKDPDGTWHKNSGSYTITGQETYVFHDNTEATYSNHYGISVNVPFVPDNGTKTQEGAAKLSKLFLYKYANADKCCYFGTVAGQSVNINFINDNATTAEQALSAITGITIQYQLGTPTTEQGTSFAENIEIDDYGMMYWLDTDGNLVDIPQGVKVFYPADYVLWLDTAVSTTNGDATDIALKSEITDTALATRGYNKTVDLSAQITDVAGLTYTTKKAYKTGNIVTITIQGANATGSAIEAEANLLQLGSGLAPTDGSHFALARKTGGFMQVEVKASGAGGYIVASDSIVNSGTFKFDITYILS